MKGNPGCSRNRGFSLVAPIKKGPPSTRESPCHDRRRLSSVPSQNRCRLLVPQPFVSGCVAFLPAERCFTSALTVIEVSSIAPRAAVRNPAVCSAARPTAAMSKVSAGKDVSTIASVNANIASA